MSIALLKQHIEDNGLSQKQAGSQLGVSPTVVNLYLKGAYTGDVAGIDKKVAELVARHAQKAKDLPTDFIATPTAKRILETCSLAHAMADIQIVIGEAGLGKTMALKEYAAQKDGVVMIEVDPTFGAKVLLTELCNTLGLTLARNNHAMMTVIVDKLKGSGRLLIVDEAELLTHKPLEILRRLHDKAGIGIVLAGMPRLRANLRGARGEYKQLYSRVGLALDIKTRLPERDIAMLAEVALDTDAFNDVLYDACGGNARKLNKLLRGIKHMSHLHKEPVNAQMIERFNEMLIG